MKTNVLSGDLWRYRSEMERKMEEPGVALRIIKVENGIAKCVPVEGTQIFRYIAVEKLLEHGTFISRG